MGLLGDVFGAATDNFIKDMDKVLDKAETRYDSMTDEQRDRLDKNRAAVDRIRDLRNEAKDYYRK